MNLDLHPQTQVVAGSAGIEVLFAPGQGDHLLVTFNGLGTSADGSSLTAASLAARMGWPVLGFMSREGNWFPPEEIAALRVVLEPWLAPYANRLGYGFSMGGYGAIRHSRALGLTHVLALSPQWSIDPAVAPWERRYVALLQPWHAAMQIRGEDCNGQISVMFDDLDEDRLHAERIAAAYPVTPLIARYAGHETFRLFLSSEVMEDVFGAVLRGDVAAIRDILRRRRRGIAHFASRLMLARAMRLFARGRHAEAEPWARQAMDGPEPVPGVGWMLCRALIAMGRAGEAEAVMRREIARSPEIHWLGLHLCLALEAQGRHAAAWQALLPVLQASPELGGVREASSRLRAALDQP